MIKTFCDRCDEQIVAERQTRVRIGTQTTYTEAYRSAGMRYDSRTDEQFSHELCDRCADALRAWISTTPRDQNRVND